MHHIKMCINTFIVLETQPGSECCGSKIDFSNNTSPTGAFQRITTGPSFYVAKGKSKKKIYMFKQRDDLTLVSLFRLQFDP